jgi:hypothetical protein
VTKTINDHGPKQIGTKLSSGKQCIKYTQESSKARGSGNLIPWSVLYTDNKIVLITRWVPFRYVRSCSELLPRPRKGPFSNQTVLAQPQPCILIKLKMTFTASGPRQGDGGRMAVPSHYIWDSYDIKTFIFFFPFEYINFIQYCQ